MHKTSQASTRPVVLSVLLMVVGACLSSCAPRYGLDDEQIPSEDSLGLPRAGGLAPGVWYHEASDLDAHPGVTFGTLPNGLRYAIAQSEVGKDEVSLRLRLGVGWLMEAPKERGFAHLVEHAVFEGSKHFDEVGVFEYFGRQGVAPGGGLNAFTSPIDTTYELDLPDQDGERLERGFLAFRDFADGAFLDERAVAQERRVIAAERRERSTARLRVSRELRRAAFARRARSEKEEYTAGDTPGAQDIEAVRAFYKRHYVPGNATLVVAGNIDTARAVKLIESHFSSWRGAPANSPLRLASEDRLDKVSFVRPEPSKWPRVELQFSRPWADRIDARDWRRRDLYVRMGFRILASRLRSFVSDDDIGFGYVRASNWRLVERGDAWSLSGRAADGRWNEAADAIATELRRAYLYGFIDDELTAEVERQRENLRGWTDGDRRRSAADLADDLFEAILEHQVFMDPVYARATYDSLLDAATASAVTDAFRAYVKSARRTTVMYGAFDTAPDAGEVERSVTAAMKGWPQPRDITVPAVGAKSEFKYALGAAAGRSAAKGIVSRETIVVDAELGLELTRIEFANGVIANLLPTSFSFNEVEVAVRFGAGYAALPRSLEGADTIIAGDFIDGGVEGHDAKALNHMFSGRFVGASLKFSNDSLRLTNTTEAVDLDDQLALMAAYLDHPTYEADELDEWRDHFVSRQRFLDASAEGVVHGHVKRWVRNNDHRVGEPSNVSIAALTQARIKQWMDEQRQSGSVEIAIVGDFEPDTALPGLAATFGTIAARTPVSRAALAATNPLKVVSTRGVKSFVHKGSRDRAAMRVYWQTPGREDEATAAALDVAARAFNMRLDDELRAVRGLSYGPDAYFEAFEAYPQFGLFEAEAMSHPSAIDTVGDVILEVAGKLAREGLDPALFERSRAPDITYYERLRFSNAAWMNWAVLGSGEHPERLDKFANRVALLERMTAEDVRAVIARYLTPERSLRVRVVPR